jgi:putative hemolysin
MSLGQTVELALLVGCLVMIGVFCAAEAAFVSVNRAAVRAAANGSGTSRASLADRLLEDRASLLARLLVGINVFTVASSVLCASLADELWGPVGLAAAAPVLVGFILIFAEIAPKHLAYGNPTAAAIKLAPLVNILSAAFRPVASWFMSLPLWLARSRALGAEVMDVTPDSLAHLVALGEERGSLHPETSDLVLGILATGDRAVQQVMTRRDSAVMVDGTATLLEAAAAVSEAGLSRLPVIDHTRDRVLGVLHARDVAALLLEGREALAGQIARPVLRVLESMPARKLLGEMRRKRQHLAVVTDRAGRMVGLVTMHDLIEEMLGGDELDKI